MSLSTKTLENLRDVLRQGRPPQAKGHTSEHRACRHTNLPSPMVKQSVASVFSLDNIVSNHRQTGCFHHFKHPNIDRFLQAYLISSDVYIASRGLHHSNSFRV